MTAKCYSKGSEYPKLETGKLRVYSMRFCPFSERTLLVLAAKNIPHEVININLKDKPEWLFEKHPLGKIPILEQDKKLVADSIISSDYIDEIYPDNKLTAKDPYQKAKDRMVMEVFGKVTLAMSKVSRGGSSAGDAWNDLINSIDDFEKELKDRKSTFFGGDKPGILDYMIWPWFERIPVAQALNPSLSEFPTDRFPTITKWVEKMKTDPAVKKVSLSPEMHVEFIKSTKTGEPDYDLGL
ncbi:pyrimidodiazepine synthase-like [Centruroides vittatus]|uniref:pyrimidodiazepine synthase-like n=1 Tax=Centruroides vittatus TaxID=120091 RepID=UPI0035109773